MTNRKDMIIAGRRGKEEDGICRDLFLAYLKDKDRYGRWLTTWGTRQGSIIVC